MKHPKFHYKEEVLITEGFYKNFKGLVMRYHRAGFFNNKFSYEVNTTAGTLTIEEKDLKSLTYPNKEFDDKLQKIIQ